MTSVSAPPAPSVGRGRAGRSGQPARAHGSVLVGLAVGVAVLASALAAAPPMTVLDLQLESGERVSIELPSDRFDLRFEHSVNGFHVRETLEVRDGLLIVTDQWVDGDGAGIDEVAGESQWRSAGGGWRHLPDLDREMPTPLVIRVGAVADHRLVVGCRRLPLRDVAAAYSAVQFSAREVGPVAALGLRARAPATTPTEDCGPPVDHRAPTDSRSTP